MLAWAILWVGVTRYAYSSLSRTSQIRGRRGAPKDRANVLWSVLVISRLDSLAFERWKRAVVCSAYDYFSGCQPHTREFINRNINCAYLCQMTSRLRRVVFERDFVERKHAVCRKRASLSSLIVYKPTLNVFINFLSVGLARAFCMWGE